MGSLVYLRHGIENSPYRSLLETNQWAEICNIFTRDACALLGLSVESPLSVRLEARVHDLDAFVIGRCGRPDSRGTRVSTASPRAAWLCQC